MLALPAFTFSEKVTFTYLWLMPGVTEAMDGLVTSSVTVRTASLPMSWYPGRRRRRGTWFHCRPGR